jgi:hypothetical protein
MTGKTSPVRRKRRPQRGNTLKDIGRLLGGRYLNERRACRRSTRPITTFAVRGAAAGPIQRPWPGPDALPGLWRLNDPPLNYITTPQTDLAPG